MRTYSSTLRGVVVVLLVGSACLFAVGSTVERNHRHHEHAAPAKHVESGGEAGEGAKPHVESAKGEAGVRILGIDTESLGLSIVAVVASLLLAVAVWLRPMMLVLVAVAGFGLVFAAGDGRELVHQLDESNGGLAAIAALLLAIHLLIAAFAIAVFTRKRAVEGTSLPGAVS